MYGYTDSEKRMWVDKMKVKHALIIGVFSLSTLIFSGYLLYDGLTLTDSEVKQFIEKKYQTEVTLKDVEEGQNGKLYIFRDKEGFDFEVTTSTADSRKPYVKTSTYKTSKSKHEVQDKIQKFEELIKPLGFSLYQGEDEPESFAIGVTEEGETITRLSLQYHQPLSLVYLNETYDNMYNVIKLVRGLELDNPYLDIRGYNEEEDRESGRVILTDLDEFQSSEDVYKLVLRLIDESGELESLTVEESQ